jgi:hypothetical protein
VQCVTWMMASLGSVIVGLGRDLFRRLRMPIHQAAFILLVGCGAYSVLMMGLSGCLFFKFSGNVAYLGNTAAMTGDQCAR